ncbi:hypothetical protein [Aquibacillus rhizosphaerae]|uniref:Lipoprotein YvcA n=1 Tax=Aquibacillus rhizosphaerae TaxID=3051431 RepID=A0ABT7L9T8_9BACI|nr:hypothetical protein [Aquibacillus sp. LR5S19]MDL4842636.1 hypothetical protein [Aquibacillus sp. LR5S19]
MKIKQTLPLIIILVILGGCQFSEAQLPETKAFQDEFTREFMDSTEEVKDGYYLFRSKTDRYTMLFPEDAEIASGAFYERNKDSFENLSFVDYSREENYNYTYDAMYSSHRKKEVEINLRGLSRRVGYDGGYQEIEEGNTLIYLAKEQEVIENEDRKRIVYRFFSYIVPKGGSFGIEYIYSSHCYDETNCKMDPKKEEEKALMLMKSVHFNMD